MHWRKLAEKQASGWWHSPMCASRSLFLHDGGYKRAWMIIWYQWPRKGYYAALKGPTLNEPMCIIEIVSANVHNRNWQCTWGCHQQSGQKQRKHSGWAPAASQRWHKKGRLTHSHQVPRQVQSVSTWKQVNEYMLVSQFPNQKGAKVWAKMGK